MDWPTTGEEYTDIAQMPDGEVLIAAVGGSSPTYRVTNYLRRPAEVMAERCLSELAEVAVEKLAGPTAGGVVAGVQSLHPAGYALVQEATGAGLQVWQYTGGAWSLVTRFISSGQTYSIEVIGGEPYVLGQTEAYVLRGSACVPLAAADLPKVIREYQTLRGTNTIWGGTTIAPDGWWSANPSAKEVRWRGAWYAAWPDPDTRYNSLMAAEGQYARAVCRGSVDYFATGDLQAFAGDRGGVHCFSWELGAVLGLEAWGRSSWLYWHDNQREVAADLDMHIEAGHSNPNGLTLWFLGRRVGEGAEGEPRLYIIEDMVGLGQWFLGATLGDPGTATYADEATLPGSWWAVAGGAGPTVTVGEPVYQWIVTLAGLAGANGTYEPAGVYGGEPCYTNGTYWLYFDPAAGVWCLNGSLGTPAAAAQYADGVDLATGTWVAGEGGGHVPVLTQGAFVGFTWIVAGAADPNFNGTYYPVVSGSILVGYQNASGMWLYSYPTEGPDPVAGELVAFFLPKAADADRVASAVRLVPSSSLADMEDLRAIIRADSEGEAVDAWETYQEVSVGANVELAKPGYEVRVGLVGPSGIALPGVQVTLRRDPA